MGHRVRMRKDSQNDFIKTFERLTGRRSSWQAWTDFVNMAACSIANAVDRGPRRKQRELSYLQAAGRYSQDELKIFARLLAMTAQAMEDEPEQDFLGEMFGALELTNHWKGQFFTPYSVCRMMAQIQTQGAAEEIEQKGYISVNDPACGAGALLVAAANSFRKSDINFQKHILFVGQDIDPTAAMMCYIQISLLGCPGYVIVGDTLRHPPTERLPDDYEVWYTPMYFSDVWHWRWVFRSLDKTETQKPVKSEPQNYQPSKKPASGLWFFFDLQSIARKEG